VYCCCVGLLTQDTQIYLHSPGTQQASAAAAAPEDGGRQQQHAENAAAAELLPQSLAAARAGVVLLNARQAKGIRGSIYPPSILHTACATASSACRLGGATGQRYQAVCRLCANCIAMPTTSDPLPLPPLSCRQRPPAGFSRSSVKVVTNDGEWFPVKRVLLRPCIALTTALRAEQAGPSEAEVPVDIDTLTFDR
jgi:hypothetical protein